MNKRLTLAVVLLLISALFFSGCSSGSSSSVGGSIPNLSNTNDPNKTGPSQATTSIISGQILLLDKNQEETPLTNANVIVLNPKTLTKVTEAAEPTDKNGKFTILSIPAGQNWIIEATKKIDSKEENKIVVRAVVSVPKTNKVSPLVINYKSMLTAAVFQNQVNDGILPNLVDIKAIEKVIAKAKVNPKDISLKDPDQLETVALALFETLPAPLPAIPPGLDSPTAAVKFSSTLGDKLAVYPQVTTIAGNEESGYRDGRGKRVRFNYPVCLAVSPSGDVYVTDTNNRLVRRINSRGETATVAKITGSPTGIAIDNKGNIYVADKLTHSILRVSTSGHFSVLAGRGKPGFADGDSKRAMFNSPKGLAVDNAGNIYVADTLNNRIRKVTPDGRVTTIAGTGTRGCTDGPAHKAVFNQPKGVALDNDGNIYVADTLNNRIRKITHDGKVITITGDVEGFLDGSADTAKFSHPEGIIYDNNKKCLYIADSYNNLIRVMKDNQVKTIAGDGERMWKDGSGNKASFKSPTGLALDRSGNLYVADPNNHCIRKLNF